LFPLHTSNDANVLSYLRKKDKNEVIVFLNLSDHALRFNLLDSWIGGTFKEAFMQYENNFSENRSFVLRAWEWMVWVK